MKRLQSARHLRSLHPRPALRCKRRGLTRSTSRGPWRGRRAETGRGSRGARPPPVCGRRWPHVVGSDEGPRGWVGTSREPSSDPCSARATFSHKWEKAGAPDFSVYARKATRPLVRTAGLEPALPCEKQIFLPLRLSPPPFKERAFVVWTIPSPWRHRLLGVAALGAPRLVSTPSRLRAGLGSGLAWARRLLGSRL